VVAVVVDVAVVVAVVVAVAVGVVVAVAVGVATAVGVEVEEIVKQMKVSGVELANLMRALQRLENPEDPATQELEKLGFITVNPDGIELSEKGKKALVRED
jgi:ribosomal protein S19E (S16A)